MLTVAAAILGFILWPDLWDAPLQTYSEYLKNIVGFSGWNGKILFEGTFYNKDNYPNYFILKLLGLQLTIPTLVVGLIGLILFLIKVWRKEYHWILGGLLIGWFALPIIAVVILHPVIYNNFRHFIFVLPPFFIFAGIAIDWIFSKLTKSTWRVLLIAVLLLPSLIGIIQLHPYEYIYYNEFAGGVNNAFRVYELDYWKTSFTESMLYINSIAPPNAVVSFNDGMELVPWFVRDDIILQGRIRTLTPENIDYVVISTNLNRDQDLLGYFPNMIPIFTVERDGVPLSVVYEFVGN
ncbi:MAG TPA: hypothetical protein VJ965_05670 [Anaerolineales bacterium]|nr:hypothetical protein [Anaerolineales bacterium]